MDAALACAGAFGVGFITEWAYVGFVRATVARTPLVAALWCSLLVALGWAAVFLMVTMSWWMAIPGLSGHSLGTYLAVRRSQPDVVRQDGTVGPPC
jgi:hypothetical protein